MQRMAKLNDNYSNRFYSHDETVVDGISEPLLIPATPAPTVVLVDTAGSAKVQYTLSSIQDVNEDTADWLDWPAGEVTEKTIDSVTSYVTALRLQSTGESSWEVKK